MKFTEPLRGHGDGKNMRNMKNAFAFSHKYCIPQETLSKNANVLLENKAIEFPLETLYVSCKTLQFSKRWGFCANILCFHEQLLYFHTKLCCYLPKHFRSQNYVFSLFPSQKLS